MHTMRSVGSTRESRAASRVVLPVPVAPVTKQEARPATRAARTSARLGVSVPAAISSARLKAWGRLVRRQMRVPSALNGGRTALSRVPSASVASTTGLASSRRLPALAAMRTASARTWSSGRSWWTSSRPRPRSIQLRPAPTSTSVTPSVSSRGCSQEPAPSTSRWTRSWSRANPSMPVAASLSSSSAVLRLAPRASAPRTRSSSSAPLTALPPRLEALPGGRGPGRGRLGVRDRVRV